MDDLKKDVAKVLEDFGTAIEDNGLNSLFKDAHSKNITADDWNYIVQVLGLTSADSERMYKAVEQILAFSDATLKVAEEAHATVKKVEDSYTPDPNTLDKSSHSPISGVLTFKDTDGAYRKIPVDYGNVGDAIVVRNYAGRIKVSSPSDNNDAVNKMYVKNHFVPNPSEVNGVSGIGVNDKIYVTVKEGDKYVNASATYAAEPYTIPVRAYDGTIAVGVPTISDEATNKKYVDDADITKISIAPSGNDVDGRYSITLERGDGTSLTAEIDLPLEAVKVASIDDYVAEDGKRMLRVTYADDKHLDVELDELFRGIMSEDAVRELITEATADKVTSDEVNAIVATETEGKLDKSDGEGIKTPFSVYGINLQTGKQEQMSADHQLYNTSRGAIVKRYGMHILVPENPEEIGVPSLYSNVATSKAYVDKVTAPIAENANKIADNTKRIENLESTLLTFIEDNESAYEKDVPVGVGKNAVLSSISGASLKNLLDPKLFGLPVNEDGSINYSFDFGGDDHFVATAEWVDLPVGTYYLTYRTVVKVNASASYYAEFENGTNTVEVTEEIGGATVVLTIAGTGYCEADFYVMLSTEPDAEFAPYGEEGHTAPVTKIESISPQLLDHSEIKVGYYEIDTGNIAPAQTYRSFVIPLKAGEYTLNSSLKLTTSRIIVGSKVENYGGVTTPHTFTVENDGNFGFSFRLADGATGNIADAKIMLNKGKEALPYEEYGTVNSTVTIPSEIQALNGYGKDGFVLDLESKTTEYEGETTDVSQYLTDYDKFKSIKVQGGGKVRFVNEHKIAVPSEITYVKAKE